MKKFGTSLLLAAVVVVFAVWLVDYVDTFESHYETYQKLYDTEQMNQGWVSQVIPKSSYDIHETHRVEGGLLSVRFRFKPGDTKDLAAHCSLLSGGDPSVQRYNCTLASETVTVTLEADGQGQLFKGQ
jgi:hypothetical protein